MNTATQRIISLCAIVITGLIGYYILKPQLNEPIEVTTYPVDVEMRTYFGHPNLPEDILEENKEKLISVFHQVTYNPIDKNYLYVYKLTQSGNQPLLFHWDVMDRAINNNKPCLIDLEPNVTREFSVVSKHVPQSMIAAGTIYQVKNEDQKSEILDSTTLNVLSGPVPIK